MKTETKGVVSKAVAAIRGEQSAVATTSPTPLDMLNRAMEKGVSAEELDKYIDLHSKWEAKEAERAFIAAMSRFRSEPILIEKTKVVSFGNTNYQYAPLDQIIAAALPALSANGLSHRWETTQEGAQITVTCVLTHEQGHNVKTSLTATPDDSGGKNSIQAIGSTVSYLEKYTFMAATGLAASDMDNDAVPPAETITDDQVANLEALIDEVNADRSAFLAYCQIDSLDNLPISMYKTAVQALERKRAQ